MRRRTMMNGGLKSVITINQTIDDPYSRVSGDVNGSAIRWIRENSHRYLGKYKDGVMYICQLDDSNSNYYHDGTPAVLTGAEGDVFMRMPNFYYCGTEGDVVDITFSTVPFDNCVPWMDNALIGVYEMYVANNKGYSISNSQPLLNYSYNSGKSFVSNRGTGYQQVDWQMHCVISSLYFAMYGNTDFNGSIGKGTDSFNKKTGQTDSLGMFDTVAGGNGDSQSTNFWGVENWIGDCTEYIHDFINVARTMIGTVNDPVNGGVRQLSLFAYEGHPKKMRFGRYLDLIVSTDDPKNGSYTTGYCSSQNWKNSVSYNRIAQRSFEGRGRGIAACIGYNSLSNTYTWDGSRFAFRGNIVEIDDVQTFKNIVATN